MSLARYNALRARSSRAPRRWTFASGLVLTLALVLGPGPSRASPLPATIVADALADLAAQEGAPRSDLARLLTLAHQLDALAPEAALAALGAIATPTRLAARDPVAILAAHVRAGLSGGPEGLVHPARVWVRVDSDPVLGAAATLDDLHSHHRLFAASAGRPSGTNGADAELTALAPSGALQGGVAFGALVPPRGGVLHVAIPIDGRETIVHLGASGDLVASLARPGQAPRPLGQALGLRRGAPDQLQLSLPGDGGTLLLSLRPHPADPAILRVRFAGPTGASASPPTWLAPDPQDPAWGAAATAALPEHPLALGESLDALVIRRMLGLPDRGAALESLLGDPAREPDPVDLVLALAAVAREEDRASLLQRRVERLPPRGRARAPEPIPTLALAHRVLERGQPTRAAELIARVEAPAGLEDLRRLLSARLSRLRNEPELALTAFGLDAPELSAEAVAARVQGWSTRDRLEAAEAALAVGRATLAAPILDGLARALPGRVDLAAAAIRGQLAAGRVDEAIALADALARRRPDRPIFALDAADRHLSRGTADDREIARALVDASRSAVALDPDLLARAGRALERMGDRAGAIELYGRALTLAPTSQEARDHLERLQGEEPAPLSLGRREVERAPVIDPDASFEVLGEETFVRVRADGSATRWHRRILRAQTVPDAREARTLRVRFDPSQESVKVLAAHIHRVDAPPTAPPEPVTERLVQALSEDWYGLYYDLRQLAIPFDHLRRGDLLEVTWRVDPVGQHFPGVFDLFEVLADRVPKHLLRMVVDAEPGITLRARLSLPAGSSPARFDERAEPRPDGGQRFVLEGRDLPGVPAEPLSPGASEVAPVWQVSSFGSWREVATWYRRLIAPSRVLTPSMRARVAELAQQATPDELRRRIVDLVTREIRYVGLEFGVHGYKPYRTDEVWARGFGDCKDKATLLVTLLAEAGLPGEVVLVRTRKEGRLDGALPSIALFDHAIVYLPDRAELVDPTAIHFGLGELPREDQGAQILVLAPPDEPADLALSPLEPASRNGISGQYSVTIDRRGRAGIQAMVSLRGTQAPVYRALLLEPATREKRLAEVLNRRYPGLALTSLRATDPADRTRPVELTFNAEVPRLAVAAGGELQVPRPAGIDGQADRLAASEERLLPLVLGPPMRWELQFRYLLPEDYRAVELPAGGAASSPFGSYKVVWRDEGPVYTVEAELTLTVDQVSVTDYPAFRDFIRGFDRAVAPALVARPAPPSTPPPGPTPPSEEGTP